MEWCIADEQTPDEELQRALDWACGKGGADCSKIQVNHPCYLPNTLRDHASYAFNSYYQKFKHKGASCYFNSAAITTDLDPSNYTSSFDTLLSYFLLQQVVSMLYAFFYKVIVTKTLSTN